MADQHAIDIGDGVVRVREAMAPMTMPRSRARTRPPCASMVGPAIASASAPREADDETGHRLAAHGRSASAHPIARGARNMSEVKISVLVPAYNEAGQPRRVARQHPPGPDCLRGPRLDHRADRLRQQLHRCHTGHRGGSRCPRGVRAGQPDWAGAQRRRRGRQRRLARVRGRRLPPVTRALRPGRRRHGLRSLPGRRQHGPHDRWQLARRRAWSPAGTPPASSRAGRQAPSSSWMRRRSAPSADSARTSTRPRRLDLFRKLKRQARARGGAS